jgi:hypothetical protein
MPMMQIGIVRVPGHQADVPVPMRMRLAGRSGQAVLVLVVFVVPMPVLVPHSCGPNSCKPRRHRRRGDFAASR